MSIGRAEDARRDGVLECVRRLVLSELEPWPVRVWLFGSWARGRQRRSSDIDVAVWPVRPLPADVLPKLRERLEESDVPYRVDVVDLSAVDPAFRSVVEREGILWKDGADG